VTAHPPLMSPAAAHRTGLEGSPVAIENQIRVRTEPRRPPRSSPILTPNSLTELARVTSPGIQCTTEEWIGTRAVSSHVTTRVFEQFL
jgi:hypothetical protein